MAQTTQKTPRMPADLIAAMENEDLTEDQLREIVRIEAAQLGFSLDDAIDLARANRLPKDADGTALQFHIFMLLD